MFLKFLKITQKRLKWSKNFASCPTSIIQIHSQKNLYKGQISAIIILQHQDPVFEPPSAFSNILFVKNAVITIYYFKVTKFRGN